MQQQKTTIEEKINKILNVTHSETRIFRELMLFMILKNVNSNDTNITIEKAISKEKNRAIFIVTIDDYFKKE